MVKLFTANPPSCASRHTARGFTLIEVLLALAIVAIAFTALLKASSQDIVATQQIKDKTISHWVAEQAITLIQLGLINPTTAEGGRQATTLFHERWYWHAQLTATPIKSVQQITIELSQNPAGPFMNQTIAYRYQPS